MQIASGPKELLAIKAGVDIGICISNTVNKVIP